MKVHALIKTLSPLIFKLTPSLLAFNLLVTVSSGSEEGSGSESESGEESEEGESEEEEEGETSSDEEDALEKLKKRFGKKIEVVSVRRLRAASFF